LHDVGEAKVGSREHPLEERVVVHDVLAQTQVSVHGARWGVRW
jgi:hypothetical protein